MRLREEAEGEGFEPPRDQSAPCDFRDCSKSAICREFGAGSPVHSPAGGPRSAKGTRRSRAASSGDRWKLTAGLMTPSLPWHSRGNWSQPTATVLAYLSRFRGGPICDRLPPVATALLHKRSIPLRGLRVGSVQINSLRRVRARERSHTATHTPRANLVRRRLDFVARPLLPAIRRPDRCVREDDPLVGHRGPYALRRA